MTKHRVPLSKSYLLVDSKRGFFYLSFVWEYDLNARTCYLGTGLSPRATPPSPRSPSPAAAAVAADVAATYQPGETCDQIFTFIRKLANIPASSEMPHLTASPVQVKGERSAS
jgi:hypothetical protein